MEQIDPSLDNRGGKEVDPTIGVSPDYINAWLKLATVEQFGLGQTNELAERIARQSLTQDLPTYTEYLHQKYPDRATKLLEQSDPRVVADLDALVQSFNQQREQIAASPQWQDQLGMIWRQARYLTQEPKKYDEKN